MDEGDVRRLGLVLGRLVFTVVTQAHGAPFLDGARGEVTSGRCFRGVAVHLAPWRKDRYGDRLPALALVLGWLEGRAA
jgi:hypothetical protein